MSTIVDPNTGIIHRYVYELRYEFGQIYYDRSGRVAKQLLREMDDWNFDTIDGQRCAMSNRETNLLFNFGSEKLDLSQTQNADVDTLMPVGDFSKLAENATKPVVESFGLELFSRIGFRVWNLYPTATRDEAENLIRKLKLFGVATQTSDLIQKATEVSHRLVTDRGTHMLRIAIAPFEQNIQLSPSILQAAKTKARDLPRNQKQALIEQLKAEKRIAHYPQLGVMLDIDAYLEDPPMFADLSVSDFITVAYSDMEQLKGEILESL